MEVVAVIAPMPHAAHSMQLAKMEQRAYEDPKCPKFPMIQFPSVHLGAGGLGDWGTYKGKEALARARTAEEPTNQKIAPH